MRRVALIALLLAGCGAATRPAAPSPEQQVRSTVTKLQTAVQQRQPGVVCAYYSARSTQALERVYGRTCEETMNEALDGVPSVLVGRPIRVGSVAVDGRRARVSEAGGPDEMTFVREPGGWKLDRAARVEQLDPSVCVRNTVPGIRASSATRGVPARTQKELAQRICERTVHAALLPRLGKFSDAEASAVATTVVQEMRSERKLTDTVADALLGL